jgi:hypothetical protein
MMHGPLGDRDLSNAATGNKLVAALESGLSSSPPWR